MPPNQVVEREVNAPMKFVLDNFNSTKLENVVLCASGAPTAPAVVTAQRSHIDSRLRRAPGDPTTAVHDFIAVGMVRKTLLDIVETVTDVEWSETKIMHKYRTNAVSGPPCCCIYGYGAEMSVESLGPNKSKVINKAFQDTKWCSPLTPCCICLCWNSIGNSFLVKDIDVLEAKWAKMQSVNPAGEETPLR
jgi:hypothetical protein